MTRPEPEDRWSRRWVNGENVPWMVKFVVWMADKFGPLSLILAIALGVWTGYIPSPITASHEILSFPPEDQRKSTATCGTSPVTEFQSTFHAGKATLDLDISD